MRAKWMAVLMRPPHYPGSDETGSGARRVRERKAESHKESVSKRERRNERQREGDM